MNSHGPDLLGIARAIHRHSRADRARLQAFQDAKLRRLLVHAYEHVPYYHKLFDRHRLHPRHIRGVIDLDLIPFTTKQDLLAVPPSDMLAKGVQTASLAPACASGSAGDSPIVRRTRMEQGFQAMFRERAFESYGLRLRGRIATLGASHPGELREATSAGRWLSAMGVHPTLWIDGLQEPGSIVGQLEAFRPDLITAPAGMLLRVADHLIATGHDRIRPRIVVVGGESPAPHVRRRLAQAFGVAPLQTYARNEFQLLGWECRTQGGIHTCDDSAIVEVLVDGRPAALGEEGEVVATSLHAYAMPLIRYRLTDKATRGPAACACGQPFSVIGELRDA